MTNSKILSDLIVKALFEREAGLANDLPDVEANNQIWMMVVEEFLKATSSARLVPTHTMAPAMAEFQMELFQKWSARKGSVNQP